MRATALFVDGPCRLQKRVLRFDVQPPEFLSCGGERYTISANQGIDFLNYVVQGGPNDSGYQGVRGQRDVFRAWSSLHHALNHTAARKVSGIRRAGRRIRRVVR